MRSVTKDASQYIDNKEHDELFRAKRTTSVGTDDRLEIVDVGEITYMGRVARGTADATGGWVLTKIENGSFKHAIDSWDNRLTADYK